MSEPTHDAAKDVAHSTCDLKPEVLEVVVTGCSEAVGLGLNAQQVITLLTPGGPAARCGGLEVGDRVVSVDGVSLEAETADDRPLTVKDVLQPQDRHVFGVERGTSPGHESPAAEAAPMAEAAAAAAAAPTEEIATPAAAAPVSAALTAGPAAAAGLSLAPGCGAAAPPAAAPSASAPSLSGDQHSKYQEMPTFQYGDAASYHLGLLARQLV